MGTKGVVELSYVPSINMLREKKIREERLPEGEVKQLSKDFE